METGLLHYGRFHLKCLVNVVQTPASHRGKLGGATDSPELSERLLSDKPVTGSLSVVGFATTVPLWKEEHHDEVNSGGSPGNRESEFDGRQRVCGSSALLLSDAAVSLLCNAIQRPRHRHERSAATADDSNECLSERFLRTQFGRCSNDRRTRTATTTIDIVLRPVPW